MNANHTNTVASLKAQGFVCRKVDAPWCSHYAVFDRDGKRVNYPASTFQTARQAWCEAATLV